MVKLVYDLFFSEKKSIVINKKYKNYILSEILINGTIKNIILRILRKYKIICYLFIYIVQ